MTEHLELVKRAKSGDEEAFIRLMESQSDCMYKMAKNHFEKMRMMWRMRWRRRFWSVGKKLSTLKENRYVKTWMIRILMNKCYDLLRKKRTFADGRYCVGSRCTGRWIWNGRVGTGVTKP